MSQFTWSFDAPTGTFKSHQMSASLLESALEVAVAAPYAKPADPAFGKRMGESTTLTRIATITEPTSPVLSESNRIPEDSYSISTKQITVVEIGRAVPFTSLATDLSNFDLENSVQKRLRDQMMLSLDTLAFTALKSTQLKYAITGLASNNVTANGTFGAASTENLNVYHVEEIRDLMFDTYHIPPAEGDDYIGIFRTLGLRGLKRDPAWEEWHKYTDPAAKFNNEIGRLENIRFVETNHANGLGKVGTGSVLGEGVVFGDDALALAEAQSPELRAAIPQDFGRSKAVAWYGILKYDLFWETGNAGEVKVLHVGSL